MKSKQLLIQAFDEPNHTQTPNKFFDMLPDMGEAELRVTLVMIRHTFGYHRDTFKMGLSKLAKAAGLTENGARNGAKAAEERGIFKRVNPDSQKEAEWALNVTPNVVDPQRSEPLPPTTLTPTPNHVDHTFPIKESIKENKIPADAVSEIIEQADKSVDAMLGFEKLAHEAEQNGKAWRGRELLAPEHLQYGDWWHAKTGLHMYGAKAKPKIDTGWYKAFKELYENEVTIEALEEAWKYSEWRHPLSSPMQIVNEAKAIQSLPKQNTETKPEGKGFYA